MGGIFAGLGFAIVMVLFGVSWMRREKLQKKIYANACPACGVPFEDAMFDYLGMLSNEEKSSLDTFQQRYACCKVRCGGCGAYVICADNGEPMKAHYPKE
ncbi:MAG: hypothetical protein HRU15_04810 [Planctomycetes bacterium]|nr:hypothetical protein [Planctomycetota bacterium]